MDMPLSPLNTVILLVYLAAMLAVGIVLAVRQKSTEDYFLAGRNMGWLAVGMSMFASVTSAVTYIGVPGMVFKENISLIVFCFLSPLIAPVLIVFIYPFYRSINATTSYEYISKRFGYGTRPVVSSLFILARLGWLGTVIYAPALALSVMSGMPLWLAICLMGFLATAYTVLGGIAADIWTDVIQYGILVIGAVWVAVALAFKVPDGVPGIMAVAAHSGHLQVFTWKISLFEMSAAAVLVSFTCQILQEYGTDQVTVQRLLTIRDMKGTMKAILYNAATDFFVTGLLLFIGLGLFAFYQGNPALASETTAGDRILPFFIMHHLPNGVSGLLIAAILAAAMSSMDSGINSIATVVMNDFLKPAGKLPGNERSSLRLARLLTLILGVFATGVAFYVSTLGQIIKVFFTFMSLFNGPVLALFLLGFFTVRGRFVPWVIGAVVTIPATLWLQNTVQAHWVWYLPFATILCLAVSYGLSFIFRDGRDLAGLTVWTKKA